MPLNADSLLARRKKLLGPALRLFYADPLHIVRGEGVWLYDADGRKYLDMYNNVPHVGHCHPQVVDAIARQGRILNTHTRYLHELVLDYAERLTATLPDALDVAMFSCTGTEANELALRIARTVTGGVGVIVTDYSYHGNSQAIAEISTEYDTPETRRPHVVAVPAPDVYRGRYRGDDAAERYALHVAEAVELLQSRGIKPAALVLDTIISSDGVVSVPPGYLSRAAGHIRAAGGLFVADEVQPGFGRTGETFWGFEIEDVVPDIVTMGKPMGNGHPLAATVTRTDIASAFARDARYFNTFGGNPVSAAAGLAVLDVLETQQLQRNALDVGRRLTAGLKHLAERHERIGDVRGTGLFLAAELVEDKESRKPATGYATRVVEGLRNEGVLTNTIGRDDNILKLRPPMVLSRENAELFLDILGRVLAR
ncbi:MAG: aminotransferase class III-fold pyridoxal phosphate-dependent enzyme [Woeseia sp.]